MEHKESGNPYAQSAHDKAQDAIDHARQVRETRIADRGKGKTDPHLIADGKLQRCSVCSYPFSVDENPSITDAFAVHLAKAHRPGQTSEDVNQAAAGIVREAMKD
jgi:hypothetical protein